MGALVRKTAQLVEVVFDKNGTITSQRGGFAVSSTEGPRLEERARSIAMAVHKSF